MQRIQRELMALRDKPADLLPFWKKLQTRRTSFNDLLGAARRNDIAGFNKAIEEVCSY